jgi:hypothetical protein
VLIPARRAHLLQPVRARRQAISTPRRGKDCVSRVSFIAHIRMSPVNNGRSVEPEQGFSVSPRANPLINVIAVPISLGNRLCLCPCDHPGLQMRISAKSGLTVSFPINAGFVISAYGNCNDYVRRRPNGWALWLSGWNAVRGRPRVDESGVHGGGLVRGCIGSAPRPRDTGAPDAGRLHMVVVAA